jgi:hypothetical protein
MALNEILFKNSFANYRVAKENQRLFLNNSEIVGVQSVRFSSNSPFSSPVYLGMTKNPSLVRGQLVGTMDVDRLLVNSEQLFNYTGSAPITGYCLSSRTPSNSLLGMMIGNGYLTNYSFRYNDGEIPTSTASFVTFSNIGWVTTDDANILNSNSVIPTSDPNYNLKIPARNSVSVSLSEFTTNRVLGIDLSYTANVTPQYSMGKVIPYRVDVMPPAEITIGFRLELGDYQFKNLSQVVENNLVKDINISLSDYRDFSSIASFSYQDMQLISQEQIGSTQNNVIVSLQFKSQV